MSLLLDAWRDADRLLDQLLDIPADQRVAHLVSLQLPTLVHERVVRLLAAHEQSQGPLDRPLVELADVDLQGRCLGRWTLEREIGRGGMAVVYAARSLQDDIERVAAVKVMTLGALAGSGKERFQAEQAILARLNHAHIAQLFDAGVSDDGTPWLAMALVDGHPIDVWCELHHCDFRRIVGLFLDVCEAVAHAHQNLVIHRDIKPSNVLVDADGHVRLLDFGIARLADDSALATQTLWRILTPQYAAPEQLDGAPPSTAMDVYGLGALLYRLLSGRPPHAAATRERSTAPLTAPSRLVATPLRRQLGDLDAIVLKALADAPAQRYATVPALADDLRRWLAGEPVIARRPTWGYRAQRFASRHRWSLAAATTVVLTLVGGTIAVGWQSLRIREESTRARTVQDFLVGLFEAASPDAKDGGLIDTRTVLGRGAQDARTQLADGVLKAELLLVIGAIQTRLGQFEPAHRQLGDAFAQAKSAAAPNALRGRIALELGVLAMSEMHRAESLTWLDQAIAQLREEPEWREKLVDAYLFRASNQEFLGKIENAFADQAEAETIEAAIQPASPRRRMNVLQHQARTLLSAGRLREADLRLMAALALLDVPRTDDYSLFILVGDTAEDLGDWARAETNLRRGLAIARAGYPAGSQFLSVPLTYLGNYLARTGRLDEASTMLREALEIRRATPGTTTALAIPLMNVGSVERDLGRYDAAMALMIEARSKCAEDPIAELLISAQIARIHAEAGRYDAATSEATQTRERAETLQRAGTTNPAKFARAYSWLAIAMLQSHRPDLALQLLELARSTESPQAGARSPTLMQRRAAHLLALLATGQRDPALAGETELAGAAKAAPTAIVTERAYSYLVLARLAHAAGASERARQYASSAAQRDDGRQLPRFIDTELTAVNALLAATPP